MLAQALKMVAMDIVVLVHLTRTSRTYRVTAESNASPPRARNAATTDRSNGLWNSAKPSCPT